MATLDAKVLELRLLTKESTIGGASVFRIAKSLREYHSALLQDPVDDNFVQVTYESFSRCVAAYSFPFSLL